MKILPRQNLAQQTSAHLKEGIRTGRWSGRMPGVLKLAAELGVSKGVVRAALRLLQEEGCLKENPPGLPRAVTGKRNVKSHPLRVGLLAGQSFAKGSNFGQIFLHELSEAVESAGHICFWADKSVEDLGGQVSRVARMVKAAKADAWIVHRGPYEVLEWFVKKGPPCFAIGGSTEDLPLPFTKRDINEGIGRAVEELIRLGHERMVFVAPERLLKPKLDPCMNTFVATMQRHGLKVGSYHLPDWDETAPDLHRLLRELFRVTPPTALLFLEPNHAAGALSFLAGKGLLVPRDVSLFCAIHDPIFDWQEPRIATIRWELSGAMRNTLRWIRSVAAGSPLTEQNMLPSTLDLGMSLGPAKGVK